MLRRSCRARVLGQFVRDIGTVQGDAFAAGIAAVTPIATRRGHVAAGDLLVGDAVLTRDNGYQPLVRVVPLGVLTCVALGVGRLCLRPGHGILQRLAPQRAEVLIAVRHLIDPAAPRLLRAPVLALHFARHEIVLADGCWIESQPGTAAAARPRLNDRLHAVPMRKIRVAVRGRDA